MTKIIIDTDIGEDIDDLWALVLLLSTDSYDIKLISITQGNVEYKVNLVAKILSTLNKNIPIAKGVSTSPYITPQEKWLKHFSLKKYTGKIYNTYYEAYKDVLSADDCTIISLAPFTSLVSVLPLIKKNNTKIISMAGSIYKGYFGKNTPDAECNIISDIEAAKKIISSNLDLTLLPLDVCHNIIIDGEHYKLIKESKNIYASIVMENYNLWQKEYEGGAKKFDLNLSSSILYDLAPVWYLMFPQNFDVVNIPISINEQGFTQVGGPSNILVALKMHKRDIMTRFASELLCTKYEKNYDLKVMEIENKYKLIYTLRRNNFALSVYETGWEIRNPGSHYGPSKRDYYILHFVTKGKVKLIVDNTNYEIRAGECFLLPPNIMTYYESDKDDPCTYYWVGFSGFEASELLKKVGLLNGQYVAKPINFDLIIQRLKEMTSVKARKGTAEYLLLGNLYLLFADMMNTVQEDDVEDKDYINLAIEYMNSNYQKGININDITNYIGIERTYFFRLFKKRTDLSPQDFLINLRMKRAKSLLTETHRSIKDIAISTGYDNYLSFIKTFKAKVGMSPSDYRKQKK